MSTVRQIGRENQHPNVSLCLYWFTRTLHSLDSTCRISKATYVLVRALKKNTLLQCVTFTDSPLKFESLICLSVPLQTTLSWVEYVLRRCAFDTNVCQMMRLSVAYYRICVSMEFKLLFVSCLKKLQICALTDSKSDVCRSPYAPQNSSLFVWSKAL